MRITFAFLCLVALSAGTAAQDFYRGKALTLVVGTDITGG